MKTSTSDYFTKLIESSNSASKRSRTTYFLVSMTCLFIIIGVFNMELSWEKHVNFSERKNLGLDRGLFVQDSLVRLCLNDQFDFDSLDSVSKIHYEVYVDNLSETYSNEMFKRYELHLPVLGLRIFSSDLSVISSLGIIVLITWLLFSVRREYHIIQQINVEFDKSHVIEDRKFLFYGAVFDNVFTTATKEDTDLGLKIKSSFLKLILYQLFKFISPQRVMFGLRFLPSIAILTTIISDLHGLRFTFFAEYWIEISLRVSFSVICMIYSLFVAIKILEFDNKIEDNLSIMNNKI